MDNYSSPLVSIQNQIDGIRSDIYGLNTGLTNIGVLLQNDRTAEKIRLRDEEQQERILAQQQVKVGKETAIEKRVTDSSAVPIQKVERKLTTMSMTTATIPMTTKTTRTTTITMTMIKTTMAMTTIRIRMTMTAITTTKHNDNDIHIHSNNDNNHDKK